MPAIIKFYDRLRLKYFMDAEPPMHTPPPATELQFVWTKPEAPVLGATTFDEENDPYLIELNPTFAVYAIVRETLLHEMTHMRLYPQSFASCGAKGIAPSRLWIEEAVRLARLGAVIL